MNQATPLKFNPMTGRRAIVRHQPAARWREMFPGRQWRFNPWTGAERAPADIESDPAGLLIQPPGEELRCFEGDNHDR